MAFAAPAVASAGRRLLPHGPPPAGLPWERWANGWSHLELGCNCDHHTIITIIAIATTLPTTTTSSIINKTIIYIYNYIIIIMAWSSWSRSCYHDDQTIPHDTKHQPTLQIQTNTRSSLYWHWHVKGLQKVLNRWDISWLDGSKYHHHSSIRYFIVFHVPYGDPANIPRYRNNSSACVCSVASASCRGHWNALGGVPSGNLT